MSTDLNQIQKTVMDKIQAGRLSMRSRAFFLLGSILSLAGLVAATISSVFLIGLIRFTWRSHGPMGAYRLSQLLAEFPWWALILAITGLFIGSWLLKRYEFSYKHNFKKLIVLFIAAVALAGWLIDAAGLNDVLLRRGPMQGLMRQQLHQNTNQRDPGWWK